MNLTFKVLCICGILLVLHQLTIRALDIHPRFAESNFIGNEMHIQSIDHNEKDREIVVAGSSLSAKLNIDHFLKDGEGVNLGLDGSSAIYAMEKFLDTRNDTRILAIEMNTIYRNTTNNDVVLDEARAGYTYKIAEYVPFVRAKHRPVTILYSLLKEWNDGSISARRDETTRFVTSLPQLEVEDTAFSEKIDKLEYLISLAKSKKIRVVLMMLPDGGRKRDREYAYSRNLSSRYGVEFIDLKTELEGGDIQYTDGLHMTNPSATYVTKILLNSVMAR